MNGDDPRTKFQKWFDDALPWVCIAAILVTLLWGHPFHWVASKLS